MRKNHNRDACLLYAENRLSAWAKWAKNHRGNLDFPKVSLIYKAMRQTALQMKNGVAPACSAMGHETVSFRPMEIGEVPSQIAEIDLIVAQLPKNLHEVIVADYFTYGPIEIRCQTTRWHKARYSQLLECAKYTVYATLASRTEMSL